MSRSMLRALGAVVLPLALALGACSDPSTPAPDDNGSSPTQPSPAAPAPTVEVAPDPRRGECRALSWRAALSPTSTQRPRACRKRHTAETFFVGRLDLNRGGQRLAVDSPAVQAQPRRICTRRLATHLGVTPRALRLSMAQTVWFTPSVQDAAAGADWFRCDVVVVARAEKLLALPRRTAGAGGSPALAMCATAEPGSPRSARVICSSRHAWRAVATVDLPGRRLPSPARAAATMESPCRSAARGLADDPLDFRWSEERPTQAQWDAGQRYGICWVPTSE